MFGVDLLHNFLSSVPLSHIHLHHLHALTHTHSPSLSLTHTPLTRTHSLSHTHTHTHTHTSVSHIHSLFLSFSLTRTHKCSLSLRVRRWSDNSSWTNGQLPRAGDDVNINSNWLMIVDLCPPPLGQVFVHGLLQFEDGQDYNFTADLVSSWTCSVGKC